MAAVIPLFSISQSSDGLVGTITDELNYDDAGLTPADFSERSVLILDAYGDAYATVVFDGEELEATFDIDDINLWANSTFYWTGIDPVEDYEKHLQFPLGRVTENNYQNVLRLGCCSDAVADNSLTVADRYLRGAEIAAPAGNGPAWQADQDAANKYLLQVYKFSRVSPSGS